MISMIKPLGLAILITTGCGHQQNLKHKKGECIYAGNRTDWESVRTDTNSDEWDTRKTDKFGGVFSRPRTIEEALGLYRRKHSALEYRSGGHQMDSP
jgi:hypothetical protein